MRYTSLVLLVFLVVGSYPSFARAGRFVQLTDAHVEAFYRAGTDIKGGRCGSGAGSAGPFGELLCDTPEAVVRSAAAFARQSLLPLDFAVYSGDVIPHDAVVQAHGVNRTREWVLELIGNTTALLSDALRLPFIPVIGNHDSAVTNLFAPGEMAWLYDGLWALWGPGGQGLLPADAEASFREGGYYTVDMPGGGPLVIVLNTNAYYIANIVHVELLDDPFGQLAWLSEVLGAARADGRHAIIIGHVPPGVYPLPITPVPNMVPKFNRALLSLLTQFADVAPVSIYGHEHADSFRMLPGNAGVVLPAPALNVWGHAVYPGNNPGVRVYEYGVDGLITDFVQYVTDFIADNTRGSIEWVREYSACEFLGVSSVSSGREMAAAADRLNGSHSMFEQYYAYFFASLQEAPGCGAVCKREFLCSVKHTDLDEFAKCVA